MKFDMPNTTGLSEDERAKAYEGAFQQLHDCLEGHRSETRGAFKVVTDKLGELSVDVGVNTGFTKALAKRMNISLDVKEDGEVHGVEKVKAAVGAWSWKKLAVTIIPLVSGIVMLIQILGPPIGEFLVHVWQRILAANA
jgi:hypothetical protein